ncbi:EndoU domain-containing protein [Enterococcus sp. BWR-S5]|nr:EndoU domain-containing protein [Enterococcus sp. BWR-S5]
MAGLVYLNKKTKVSTSKNVANVLDDAADTKHASGSNDVLSGSKNGKNYTLDKSKSTGNVAYKKVSQPNNFTIGPDAKDHLVNSQGLVRKKGKGVIGGHNMDAFYGELRAQGFNVDDCIINKKPHPTVEGIYEIEYRVPKEVKGKLVLDEYKKIPEPKTVYDPNVFSNDQIYQWGSEAMQSGTINGRIVKGSSNDIGFTGYLDAVTGELTNFHPSMKR